jgi:peptide/nickel transport system substrate-binding protein
MKAASPSGALTHPRRRPGMRSRAALTILLAAVASASAGCSSAPTAQGPGADATIPLLREGTTYTFSNLTEQYAGGLPEANWSEHLVKLGPDGHVEPWLAQSVTQPTPTVYVYHLRHGVDFWDGDEMTSADVVNALDYDRTPSSYQATYFTNVASIAASGRYTVVITLKRPDAGWMPVLATVGGIFEKKFQQEHGASFGKPGVGLMDTGPMEIQSFDPTTGVELTANPHYWGGPVSVKHISVKFFSDDTTLALAMRAGEIDIAYPQSTTHFQSTCGCKVTSAPGDTSADVVMNVTMAPWNNIHVRRAVAYAIDRPAEVAESADPSTPDTSNSILTPGELGTLARKAQVTALLNSLPAYPYNLAKAKAELAQSPYPHGFTTTAYGSSRRRSRRPGCGAEWPRRHPGLRHLHPRDRGGRRLAGQDRDQRPAQGDVAASLGRQVRRPEDRRILGHHERGGRLPRPGQGRAKHGRRHLRDRIGREQPGRLQLTPSEQPARPG